MFVTRISRYKVIWSKSDTVPISDSRSYWDIMLVFGAVTGRLCFTSVQSQGD
jgi:hypothetical protein